MSEIKTAVPVGYADFLAEIKQRIQSAQLRASLAVNRELVLLYWGVGKDILGRQEKDGWGTKVIERLAKDLHSAFPEMRGLSPRNLGYMKAFAEAWPDELNFATACCKIALGPQRETDRTGERPRGTPLVRGTGTRQQLEPEYSRHAN